MEFEIKLKCRSGQPGFGANLKTQSAQEAKLKILLAISLCCIFMVRTPYDTLWYSRFYLHALFFNYDNFHACDKIIDKIFGCQTQIIEFLGGYVAGSLAIMADAAHLASDCISFVIGLVAIWVGGRAPDERMSFGYKRFGKYPIKFDTMLIRAHLAGKHTNNISPTHSFEQRVLTNGIYTPPRRLTINNAFLIFSDLQRF